jgi:hypothetical protein
MGLKISASKSEVVLFTRKHESPPTTLVGVGSYVMPQTSYFKYLGIFFDAGLRWNCNAKYVLRRCLERVNLKSVAGVSWGSESVLFDTAVWGTHWIRPEIWLGLFYEYGKDTHAGFGKGSIPGIALRHIAEVIRPLERCFILTDSLSSIKAMMSRKIAHQTHPLVYKCKQFCWRLSQNKIEVKLIWISSHVRVVGNELVDERAQQVALEGSIFDRPLSLSDFQSLARPALMRAW